MANETCARAAVPAGVEPVVADCGDGRAVGAAIRSHGFEAAVHLAVSPGPPGAESLAVRSYRAGGVMRFAMTSAAAVYGGGSARPAPLSPYGVWKLAAERAVHAAFAGRRYLVRKALVVFRLHNHQINRLRLVVVAGTRLRANLAARRINDERRSVRSLQTVAQRVPVLVCRRHRRAHIARCSLGCIAHRLGDAAALGGV